MAAITLWRAQPGYISRSGVGKDAIDKEVDALIMVANKTVLQGARFFRTVTSQSGTYKESGYATGLPLPPESEDSAPMPSAEPTADFPKSVSVTTRRLAVQVERAFTEDQLFSVARQMMSGLLRVGKLCIEYGMADQWNNLTTGTGNYIGADGVAYAATTHPYARRQTGTWSNYGTAAALTSTTYFTAHKDLRKRTDERGYISPIKPTLLIVPPELEKKAREIAESNQVPENAMNTAQTVTGGKGVNWMVYDYQTSATAWTLWGDLPEDQNGFLFFQKVAPSIAPLEGADKSTDIIWGERLRMRVGFGVRILRGIQHNAGA